MNNLKIMVTSLRRILLKIYRRCLRERVLVMPSVWIGMEDVLLIRKSTGETFTLETG
ncbi:hypothetical protein Phum_PHUM558860 [Pediculus humanus corporis]|uniref:Uncharacterized protein n=1 Tax=Pediculus humanus subsp. corporis TaxID=121224 RepID=E0W0L3_PEDHC|nr:uncharacterized protein Phum_PHUM558860 [Pediculus humanus corporis]EEB19169.1 hypothetical protein Phum_PHUM558860 [Pediculus humanus corporis]